MPNFIFAAIIMLSVYAGSNYYIAKRAYQWFNLISVNINWKIFAVIYICIAFSIVFGFLPVPSGIRRIINWISAYWMGVYLYLLMFILLADMGCLLGSFIKLIPKPVPHNIHFFAGLMVVVLTAGLICYGAYNATRPKHVSYTVQLDTPLPHEMNIVLISDLHLGAVNSEKNLSGIVREINALEPDIVCIAGDIFNDNFNAIRSPSEAMDLLKSITAKYGVYACLGNHDGGKSFNEMTSFLERCGIKLLNDEYAIIDNRIVLFGRVDSSPIGGFGGLKRKDITETINSKGNDLPVVVMDHNPSNIKQYGNEADMLLSGHTHRGQIFPANLITRALFTVDYGHYQKDGGPHVIVTSGAGTWGMPMRIGTNNEIVSITLR